MTPYPSLPYSHKGLKVFESVARLMSFTLAAKELHVTQSAVSRQVKQLEDDLRESLVIRKNRSISLTAKGQALYSALVKNYQSLESLVSSWQESDKKTVVIKAALSYATRSLIPKVEKLNDRYPEYEFVIIPSIEEDEAIESGEYDILILNTKLGKRYKERAEFVFLREEYMAPVCSSARQTEEVNLESILKMRRLHPTRDHTDWITWLESGGSDHHFQVRNSTFLTLDMALSACLSGQGATVTDLMLVLPELEHGYLICPDSAPVLQSAWCYYCHVKGDHPLMQELVEWLLKETATEVEDLTLLASKYNWKLKH